MLVAPDSASSSLVHPLSPRWSFRQRIADWATMAEAFVDEVVRVTPVDPSWKCSRRSDGVHASSAGMVKKSAAVSCQRYAHGASRL